VNRLYYFIERHDTCQTEEGTQPAHNVMVTLIKEVVHVSERRNEVFDVNHRPVASNAEEHDSFTPSSPVVIHFQKGEVGQDDANPEDILSSRPEAPHFTSDIGRSAELHGNHKA
jgi:hypothetical protein